MSYSSESRLLADALRDLSEVVSLAHFRMNAVVEALYGGGGSAASRRAVLRNVITRGPMTVPAIAALRPVSRQYIQSVVDGLRDDGLVELVDNPAHRRSRLVQATPAGRSLMAAMEAREDPLLAQAAEAVGAEAEALRGATDLLRRLNAHMDQLVTAAQGGKGT